MRKFNVLLVEDNPGDVLLTSEALQESKFLIEMDVVSNGKEGVDYLFKAGSFSQKNTPDIVLLDINLPLKNGHEVLRDIKSNDATREIPVIMLTTSSGQEDIMSSYQEQASCYIVKPAEAEQFEEFVKVFDRFCETII